MYYLAERRGRAVRVATDLEIFTGKTTPPRTTRAWLRGQFLREAEQKGVPVTVDWQRLKVDGPGNDGVVCSDPRRSVDPRVTKLIAGL